MHLALCAVAPTYIGACAQQTHVDARFQSGRALVADIQHRRHLVAILGIEATRREIHALHHVGVHKTQSLLLSAADEQWAVYLYAIDIHRVLIKTTSAHIVLATHLIVLPHARKSDEQVLDAATCGVWHQSCGTDVHTVHGVGLALNSANGDFAQQFFVGGEFHIDANDIACGV